MVYVKMSLDKEDYVTLPFRLFFGMQTPNLLIFLYFKPYAQNFVLFALLVAYNDTENTNTKSNPLLLILILTFGHWYC